MDYRCGLCQESLRQSDAVRSLLMSSMSNFIYWRNRSIRAIYCRNRSMRAMSFSNPINSHSQTVSDFQPSFLSAFLFFSSRARLPLIFGTQYSRRDFGRRPRRQRWPCQKQPCKKITFRREEKTRSGLPGSLGQFLRYRYPCL
jgi:hypothetical protein